MDWNPSREGSERMVLWQSVRPSQMLFLKDRSSLNMSKKIKRLKTSASDNPTFDVETIDWCKEPLKAGINHQRTIRIYQRRLRDGIWVICMYPNSHGPGRLRQFNSISHRNRAGLATERTQRTPGTKSRPYWSALYLLTRKKQYTHTHTQKKKRKNTCFLLRMNSMAVFFIYIWLL